MGSGLRIFFVRQRNGGKIATKASSRAGNRGATLVIPGETDRLASLYARARGEGGKVVLWAGGDAPNQMDWLKTAFESRFPGVTLDVTVDLSSSTTCASTRNSPPAP